MKRFPIVLIILSVAGVAYMMMTRKTPTAQALNLAPGWTALPTQAPTNTPVPSPTIGYQDTAIVAQQTAMEAVRVNAAITAEFEQRIQEQLQMTAQADLLYFQMQGWTQTAQPTAVMLTATQQAVINTQVAGQQTLQAGQLTATAQAPALMIQIADAQNYAQHKQTGLIIGWVFQILLGSAAFLGVVLTFILLFRPGKKVIENPEASVEIEPDMTPYLREDLGQGDFTKWRVPCTEEQLTELGEMVVNGERNLAINRLETSSRTLRRPTLIHLRKFFRMNGFAIELGNGEIALNDRAVTFIQQWFEDHELVSGYQFALSPTD